MSPSKEKILVIEDNEASAELFTYLLKAFGYEALLAKNGQDGVRAALSERPALILCDIHMPDMDGFSVVSVLKADKNLAHTPVLAVTALAMMGDQEKILSAGFDGYISKPIEPEKFVPYLQTFLPNRTP